MVSVDEIRRLHADAAARHPKVVVTPEAFEAALVVRPQATHHADLYLALGCIAQDAAALASLEVLLADARQGLTRLRLGSAAVDELLQRVREKVLVGTPSDPPRLVSYSATGPLSGWLRAIAVREALSARRAEIRRGPHDGPSAVEGLGVFEDPEMAHLRALYGAPFKAAFGEVFARLEARERNVLRLTYVEGLTAEQVAQAHGVHRVSVARWLQDIRRQLFVGTKNLLAERLRLAPSEFERVTRMCLSQIDVSLDRLLDP